MTIILQPEITANIISSSSDGLANDKLTVVEKPFTPPEDETSDEYWQTGSFGAIPYIWTGTQWELNIPSTIPAVTVGLDVRTDGTPGNWVAGFRPSQVRVILNSGMDEGNFGSFVGNVIFIRDSSGVSIGGQPVNWTAYEQNREVIQALTFGANDLGSILITTNLRTKGPLITLIEFS